MVSVVALLPLGTCAGEGGLLAARASSWLLGRARKSLERLVPNQGHRGAFLAFCGFAAASARRGARICGPRARAAAF